MRNLQETMIPAIKVLKSKLEIRSGKLLRNTVRRIMILVYDYINELKAINGLMSDDIQAGQYLTVVYNGL